jgi:hypothetical protein
MITAEELDCRFTYHAPAGTAPDKFVTIREAARNYAGLIAELCPESREQSLALTKLDEVVMFANAAIARRS